MKKALLIFVLSLACLAMDARSFRNTNAIWLWTGHMRQVDLQELKDKGIGNIILHDNCFTKYGADSTMAFIREAKKLGITTHVWVQCFYSRGKWMSPVDDEHNCYLQSRYDEIIGRCVRYLTYGVEAIHFDYIRFGGTAHKHNPSAEVTATGAITEFCRQASETLRAVNPRVILSAALMPEINSEYYYGQCPSQMGKYLDIIMPMIYRHSPAYAKGGADWAPKTAEWFAQQSRPAQVWAGTTTYTGDDGKVTPMNAEDIMADCETFKGTGVTGVAFFRFGLGEIPDMRKFKLK